MCIHTCYRRVCVHIHMHVCTHVCTHVYIYIYNVYIIHIMCIYIQIYMYVYITLCVCVCVCVCIKNPSANAGDMGLIPGSGRSPGEGHATHPSIPAWEKSHGQRSPMGHSPRGHQRVRHDLAAKQQGVCVCVLSHSLVSNSLWRCGLWPTRLLCPWDSPGKIAGVGCHFLL